MKRRVVIEVAFFANPLKILWKKPIDASDRGREHIIVRSCVVIADVEESCGSTECCTAIRDGVSEASVEHRLLRHRHAATAMMMVIGAVPAERIVC